MNDPQFETRLDAWLASSAPEPREALLASVLERTSRRRPLPGWRAAWAVPAMRTQSAVLVGSPTLRLARLALAIMIVAALAATIALAGAWLLRELVPRGMIVFTSSQAINFEPEPTPRWWECGDDPECIRLAIGGGEQPVWIYALDPRSADGPRRVAQISVAGSTQTDVLLSGDRRYVATSQGGCGYEILELATGARVNGVAGCSALWSPEGSSLAYTATEQGGAVNFWGPPVGLMLHVLDVETGAHRALIPLYEAVGSAQVSVDVVGWLGDSRSVLLVVSAECSPSLPGCRRDWYASVDVDTGRVQPLGPAAIGSFDLANATSVSPDGSHLLAGDSGFGRMSVVDLDGTGRRELDSACVKSPSWSPDSRSIVFLDCSSEPTITGDEIPVVGYPVLVASAESGETRIVGLAHEPLWSEAAGPRFAPDGSVIYWTDTQGTWTVGPDGAGLKQLDIPPDATVDWQ